jgi:dihydropteroate synthase
VVVRLGQRSFEPGRLLVMAVVDPAAAMERLHAVVAEGADIVEIGGGPGDTDPREEIRRVVPFVAAVRKDYPELVIGVSTGRAEVAREAGADLVSGSDPWLAEVAAECGAGVAGPLALAERAVRAGVEPERIIVGCERVRELEELVATGWPVLVSPADRDPAGRLATAAVAAWLGARVFRVDQVLQTRRVLRMVSAIRGDIPPAYAVRGLALSAVRRMV